MYEYTSIDLLDLLFSPLPPPQPPPFHGVQVNSLIFTITQRTTKVVDADRCTLYLVDNVHRGLFAMQGEVPSYTYTHAYSALEFLIVVDFLV